MMAGDPTYGAVDLQESMPNKLLQHQHGLQHHNQPRQGSIMDSPMLAGFPPNTGQAYNLNRPSSMADLSKMDGVKNAASDDDETCFTEEGFDGQNELGKGQKLSPWQRVKWTDSMVRLLITAASYISEDFASECRPGGRRKYVNLQKKGKWKLISKVMAERGFHVSPQQCEDKFNDLNKRYKKLQDILGRGTSCQVVENPALLDIMDHLSEKVKDGVRKILSSKQLFYEEMCSYHNGNRLHLPPDPALQKSLQLALRSRDDHETSDSRRQLSDDLDEDDHDVQTDECEEYEENRSKVTHGSCRDSAKRMRQGQGPEDVSLENALNLQDYDNSFFRQSQNPQGDMNLTVSEGPKGAWLYKKWIKSRSDQLEQRRLQIEQEMLELEQERFKWQRFSRKKDWELQKLKAENERMKLQNERMALELKQMAMSMNNAQ